MPCNKLQNQLGKARALRKLSQQELSELTGIKREYIAYWETGKRQPKAEEIFLLSKALEVSCDYLLGIDGDPKRKPSAANQLGLSQASVDTAIRWCKEEPEKTQILEHLISEPELIEAIANLNMLKAVYENNNLTKLIPYLRETTFRDNVTEETILDDYYTTWKTNILAGVLKAQQTVTTLIFEMVSSTLEDISIKQSKLEEREI